MRGRLAALFLVLLFAGPALSAPVRIRSGEHGEFTRIVLDLPKRAKWEISQAGDKAVLTFTGLELEFDTSLAFNRLSEGRLGEISAGPEKGSLTIELGCDCELSGFWYGRSSFVVDIRDVAHPAQAKTMDQAQDPQPESASTRETKTAPKPKTPLPDVHLSTAASLAMSELSSGLSPLSEDEVKPVEIKPADPAPARAPAPDMQKTRERLLRQISRAASQGLLSPKVDLPSTTDMQDHAKPGPDVPAPPSIAAAEVSKEPMDHINLNAQSSIDRDFLSTLAQASGISEGSACLDPDQVDVAAWGTDEPFARQIGAVRLRLSGEFDKTDEAAALELARLYLYFGFGVEANQALKLVAKETRDTALLKDLAEIFEKGYAPADSPLSGHLNCGAPVSLWSALSYQTLPTDAPMDENAILRGFNALPPHLRSYLGPVLSRRFLEAGRQATSDRVLRILDRSEETTTPDADLVKAEMNMAQGAEGEAKALLDDVVKSGSEPSAKALLLKIETALEAGDEISFETAQLAGAYAQENRDEALGRSLSQAYVVALAASGAFDQSYAEFTRLKAELEPENRQEIQSRVLGFLTAGADDATFLKHVFSDHVGQPDALDAKAANATTKRLLALGFTTKARQFITLQAAGEHGRDRALLHAEASLLENQPHQAEADLLGLTGEDVNVLRAKARSQMGEHKAAAELFASGNQPDMAKREAWLAEDWDRVLAANDPVLTDVAMLVNTPPDAAAPLPDDVGVLARDKALIEASSSTRNTIETLLNSQPGPDALKE